MKRLKLNIDNRKKLLNLNYSLLSQADVKERFNAEMTIFANGLNCTLETILPRKTRTQLSRSSKKEDIFFPLIDIRNVWLQKVLQWRTLSNCSKLRAIRKKLKMEINSTKNDWLRKQCLNLNYFGTKQAWESIRNLNVTLAKAKPSSTNQWKVWWNRM